VASSTWAQHVHPSLIDGSEHPEQVSYGRVLLGELLATTNSKNNPALVNTLLHQKAAGLEPYPLDDFRSRYDKVIADYNAAVKGVNDYSAVQAAEQERDKGIYLVLSDMVSFLRRNMADEEWKAFDAHVQHAKSKISYVSAVPDTGAPSLIEVSYHARLRDVESLDYNQVSFDGYTQYTAIDSDGTTIYQTVYAYGSSNVAWTCTRTYEGPNLGWQWVPTGCNPNAPPIHTFYATNQINGTGSDGYNLGGYSATTYVNIPFGWSSAVTGNDFTVTGFKINCPIAGLFFSFLVKYFVEVGHELVQYDGLTPTFGVFGVTPTCTNNRPWLVDISYVVSGAPAAAVAWNCWGVCTRTGPGFTWNCPPKYFKGICLPLPAATWQPCTPHP